MSDLISRQAAIDALLDITAMRNTIPLDSAIFNIKKLPSVQPEPEAISKWKKEFREYVGSLDIARDDWKGIIEYIDELPSAQPFNNITMNDVIGNIGGEEG